VDGWLHTYMSADDTPLNRAIGRLWLIAAVRRARQPGCKFDQIPVLEGPEGKGKSKVIQLLAGADNFSDATIIGLRDKEQQEACRGRWLYEIPDLSGLGKADIEHAKAFASRTHDRARPAYGKATIDQPRRCVFVGTTNDSNYLKSQTGNRRFWPVKTGTVHAEAVERDRDQLWAEAAYYEAQGAPIDLAEELWSAAGAAQEARREVDPWEDMLGDANGD
jgi:predicted P-loop ATPase